MSKQTNCTANWLLRGQSCYLCSKIIRPLNPKSYDPNPKCWKSMFRGQWQTVEPSLSLRKSLRRSRSAFLAPDPDRPPHFSPSKLQRFAALLKVPFVRIFSIVVACLGTCPSGPKWRDPRSSEEESELNRGEPGQRRWQSHPRADRAGEPGGKLETWIKRT